MGCLLSRSGVEFLCFSKDFETQSPGLVRDVFCLLWTSKEGLSETELLDILEVSKLTFSSLMMAVKDMLLSRSGLLSFYHDDIRKAVENRYLTSYELKKYGNF